MLQDVRSAADELSKQLVPEELWVPAEPLLPVFGGRPQRGETAPVDEREVFTAVVFVLTAWDEDGCALDARGEGPFLLMYRPAGWKSLQATVLQDPYGRAEER